MDATTDEIEVAGGDSVAATRRSSRLVKPTEKAQKFWQVASSQPGTSKNAGIKQVASGDNDRDNVGDTSQAVGGAARSDPSLVQMMLRTTLQTMFHDTSSYLVDKQKQMLERLWDALMENQRKTAEGISDQMETIRQLQQEIRTIRTEVDTDSLFSILYFQGLSDNMIPSHIVNSSSDDRAPLFIGLAVMILFIAILMVSMRILSRSLTRQIGRDDWAAFTTLVGHSFGRPGNLSF